MKTLLTKLLLLLAVFSCWSQPKGKIVKIDGFKSKFVQARNIEIWLPAGYDANTKIKYPVLYMQDGQNVFNAATSMHKIAWEADLTAEKLTAVHRIEPFIIVAVWNTENRYMEYFPEKASLNFNDQNKQVFPTAVKDVNPKNTELLGDEYLKFLTQELKPYIDKKYRTKPDTANTAICGSSMGALISLYALCEYPEVFGEAACLSTHWTLMPDAPRSPFTNALMKYIDEHLPSHENHRIYFDYGTKTIDHYYGNYQDGVNTILKNKGYTTQNWSTKKFEGAAHTEKDWQERFDEVLLFLFKPEEKKEKKPLQKNVAKRS
ncbi:MAG: esterase [Flavobacterium psychrophilum]|nr:MAG: esterase [Flavobacterium psychrophilum]